MLDIRLIREKPEFVRERLATRSVELAQQVDKILEIDSERRRLETQLQLLNADRNRLSKQIGMLRSKKEPSAETESQVRAIGEEIARLSHAAAAADESQRKPVALHSQFTPCQCSDWSGCQRESFGPHVG